MIVRPRDLAYHREQMICSLERVRAFLEAHAAGSPPPQEPFEVAEDSALGRLRSLFGLSAFECDVLVLAAASELDGTFPELFSRAMGDASKTAPTLSLALAAFANPTWSALLPTSPLRYWRLVEVDGNSLVAGTLRADEAVVHALLGFPFYDGRLRTVLDDLEEGEIRLSPEQDAVANEIAQLCRRDARARAQLICSDRILARAIVRRTAQLLDAEPVTMRAAALAASGDSSDLLRLCERMLIVRGAIGVFDCADVDEAQRERLPALLSARAAGPALVMTDAKLDLPHARTVAFDVSRPARHEQAVHWQTHLPVQDAGDAARKLSAQFNLRFDTIEAAANAASSESTQADLWEIVRRQTRPLLDGLMERIESNARWGDLVLPADRRRLMRQIVDHVRYRDVVFDEWGFGDASTLRGMTVLFVGASGTGKSLAARVIANTLKLDLYRVDLSAVFSKYIGETEKNLRRIFDAADSGGAVLVFDEADALFGKRSEVKDSHDRHANVEVSYLLQRLERFNGVAILTSNLREAFDSAFMRRFAFVVEFPFPDAALRRRIWKRAFPKATPTHNLDLALLARLAVPGGNIANIALNAAVRAAARSGAVTMNDIAAAVRLEYAKLDRSLHDPDLTRWLETVSAEPLMESAV